ncbi:efflux RND transporter periplasmic adaptor subunit [Nevskia ramosa]|uniref:efflux RND transporter periplasmic adaptor subunit n=1 Tax=Nevskia ramosa TaxID=64002 RepID=UPI002352BECA|nr:efflux RND transporter periplasmic adaptor subunit [Nevskia ramosa]
MTVRRRLLLLAALSLLSACQRESTFEPVATAPKADEAQAPLLARISEAAAAKVDIHTAIAGPAEIREHLPLYGTIRPNAERVREVVARFPGSIRSVAKAIGDNVAKGEVMATIESNDSLQTYPVLAPMAGTVTAREADPGEQAGSEVLFSITDLSTVWVELSLFPADVGQVKIGQTVTVASVDARLSGSGRIDLVGALGEAATQTLTARVTLPNPGRQWTPGLFVNASVELGADAAAVAIESTALQTLDGVTTVFVPVSGGYAPRSVQTGRSDASRVEILSGLVAGEAYVSAGSFVVKAELGKAGLEEDDADKTEAREAAP